MNSKRNRIRRYSDWQAYGQAHRRRQRAFYAVVKPKNDADRKAALAKALAEIDEKFGKNTIKKGDEIEAD